MTLQLWPSAVAMILLATLTAALVTTSDTSAWFVGVVGLLVDATVALTAGAPGRLAEGQMVGKLLLALGLMAVCVALHATGVARALHWLRVPPLPAPRLWPGIWRLIGLAAWIIGLHLVAITLWGLGYAWTGALPDVQTALYFSAVTYTTTGYGDLTLPAAWRLVGGVEALTGILLCGLSTGFFFAVLSRLAQARDPSAPPAPSTSEPL